MPLVKKGSYDSNPNVNQHASPIVKGSSLLVDKNENLLKIIETKYAVVGIRYACFNILS